VKARAGARGAGRTPVERLRAICLALPEATEKIAWGEPTWRVRGKLFAQLDDHHHGADHLAVWLPARLGEQEAMIFTDPARFFRPPYVGPRGWVGVRIDRRPNWTQVASLVEQAYRQVATPRLCALQAAAGLGPRRSRRADELLQSSLGASAQTPRSSRAKNRRTR
jgi:predicted DNA-binding protein (MmcQ/YjbR family)